MGTRIKDFIEKYYWIFFSVTLVFLAFLLFFKIGIYDVNDWDEARHGVNAYEMLKNNNYIANYYAGHLDYWNLKPPISYYTIILGYKIFGYNPLGLRFFSALSYIILAILVALFIKKKSNKMASLISLLIFCGSFDFFKTHFVRAGDADAVFILFIGIAILSLGLSSDNSNWYNLSFFMFALAFLTKSWHAVAVLLIIFFYWLFTKGYKKLKWWQYFTCFLSAFIPLGLWAGLRYNFDGLKFFSEMINYDLLNRSSNPIEGHLGYPFFYTIQLIKNPTQIVSLIIFVGVLIVKLRKKEKFSDLDKLCLISFLSIFIIFAIAKTKLSWYIFPTCVPLTIVGSIYACEVYSSLANKKKIQNVFKYLAMGFIIICIMASTVIVSIKKEDELQVFINTLNVNEGVIYYEVDNSTKVPQSILLCAEWKFDTIIKGQEGYSAFENNVGSYIIMSKKDYNSKTISNSIEIIASSENYVFCYNKG